MLFSDHALSLNRMENDCASVILSYGQHLFCLRQPDFLAVSKTNRAKVVVSKSVNRTGVNKSVALISYHKNV